MGARYETVFRYKENPHVEIVAVVILDMCKSRRLCVDGSSYREAQIKPSDGLVSTGSRYDSNLHFCHGLTDEEHPVPQCHDSTLNKEVGVFVSTAYVSLFLDGLRDRIDEKNGGARATPSALWGAAAYVETAYSSKSASPADTSIMGHP